MDEASPDLEKSRRHSMPTSFRNEKPYIVETARHRSPIPSPYRGPVQQPLSPKPLVGTVIESDRSSVIDPAALRRRSRFMDHWWLEIAACLLSIVSLIAIVITLRPHENRALPSWPYNISVNSLISVYVVVFKAAMLLVIAEGLGQLKWLWFQQNRSLQDIVKYDSATRGPLGSLSLLLTLGLRYPLSSFGGLITILVLPIDPIAQQLIQFYPCNQIIQDRQAKIPRTNLYTGDISSLDGDSNGISIGLLSAINAGTFSPGNLVTPDCLTGNCSFPEPYSTVAFCGGCTDVTNQVKIDWSSPEDLSQVDNTVLLYIPSGPQLNTTLDEGPTEQSLAIMQVSETQATFIFIKSPEYLKRVGGIYSQSRNGTCQGAGDLWGCLGYGAAVCTTNPCVRTYSGAVAAGQFEETWIAESNDDIANYDYIFGQNTDLLPNYPPQVLATVDTECISLLERSSLIAAGYHLDPNVRWLQYNLTFEPSIESNSSFPSSLLKHGCMYAVNEEIAKGIWTMHLADTFNGSLSRDTDEGAWLNYYGPQNLQTIYNYGNVTFPSIDNVFRNISESLTTYIRQNGNPNHSNPATGDIMRNDTCLQVRWAYLAFPTALLLATILFLGIVIIKTRPTGEGAQIWKSSPLALLFHGLEERHQEDSPDPLDEKKAMEQMARKLTVKLAQTKKGMKLVAVDDQGSVMNEERQETPDPVTTVHHVKI